jgi:hypothetical protein
MPRLAKGFTAWDEKSAVERLLSVPEAAKLAGVSVTTVKLAAVQKRLPYYLVGKASMAFFRKDVLAFKQKYCTNAKGKLLDV